MFSQDLLIIPINHVNLHWCLATVDMRTHIISYYDSMLGCGLSGKQHTRGSCCNKVQAVHRVMAKRLTFVLLGRACRTLCVAYIAQMAIGGAPRQRAAVAGERQPLCCSRQISCQRSASDLLGGIPRSMRHLLYILDYHLQATTWQQVTVRKLPKQHDRGSCGVFTCMYAKHLLAGLDLSQAFSQRDIPSLRLQMAADLLQAYWHEDGDLPGMRSGLPLPLLVQL